MPVENGEKERMPAKSCLPFFMKMPLLKGLPVPMPRVPNLYSPISSVSPTHKGISGFLSKRPVESLRVKGIHMWSELLHSEFLNNRVIDYLSAIAIFLAGIIIIQILRKDRFWPYRAEGKRNRLDL